MKNHLKYIIMSASRFRVSKSIFLELDIFYFLKNNITIPISKFRLLTGKCLLDDCSLICLAVLRNIFLIFHLKKKTIFSSNQSTKKINLLGNHAINSEGIIYLFLILNKSQVLLALFKEINHS